MARRGLSVPTSHLQRDWTQPYEASDAVEAAWLTVYRAPDQYWDLYQLGEKLTDLEDAFRVWRFARDHGGAHHRLRHRRHQRRGLPAQDAGRGAVPELWRLRTDL
jgi:tryptophan 2,3-dioxygenase